MNGLTKGVRKAWKTITLCIITLVNVNCAYGDEGEFDTKPRYYWNEDMVRAYFHNSELQRRWAFSLVGKVSFAGNEKILDVGCGDGKISSDISRFVLEGSVKGEDPSDEMIAWAKKQFHSLEYPNLSFGLGSSSRISSTEIIEIEAEYHPSSCNKEENSNP